MEPTRLELKYCERCGALGVRQSRSLENYCESCAQALTNLPKGGLGRRQSLRRSKQARVCGGMGGVQ